MKLGFWTLGMPAWSAKEIVEQAKAHGYTGVDLRCTRPDNGRPGGGGILCIESPDDEVLETRQAFEGSGVEITSLLCYLPGNRPAAPDWSAYTDDVAAHASLAARVGAAGLRLGVPRPAEGVSWTQHLEALWQATQDGLKREAGVGAVFENHTGGPSAAQLLVVAERIGDERIGVELSPDHSFVMQEDTLPLIERHAPWIHHVCFADRQVSEEDLGAFDGRFYQVRFESCVIGEGLVPAEKIFRALEGQGYSGYVALKWERPVTVGETVVTGEHVLPTFAKFMRDFGVIDA
ncbi:MAG: sugar phosphate isomerase/epimerase [Acidimicrobiaceae bacterium]|nr:sugar phosphate isomerase/epimerase [Acidimicrobiaceae bacterium]